MSEFEKKRLDAELKKFAAKNFESPVRCRDLKQIQFYVRELCVKIEEFERRFNYVPGVAYSLLAQYNERQNSMISREFRRIYC